MPLKKYLVQSTKYKDRLTKVFVLNTNPDNYRDVLIKAFGGYCSGVPPLPIPNREVKPISADGTAFSGRVGRRHSLIPTF